MASSTYRHRADDYTINSLSSFSFGNPATPAHRLDDNEVGPTDVTPRPSVIATPLHTPTTRPRDGTDVEFSSDDDHDVYDYDEEAMKIEVSSARFSDGRRASMPSVDLFYERGREDSVATLRRNSAFQPTLTSATAAGEDVDVSFDLDYITRGIADGSSTVPDFVRRPSAISIPPNSATPRNSAGQQHLLWSWGGLGFRRPSTVTVATNSSGDGTSLMFQHDDPFARKLMSWGGEGYRAQRKEWTFRRDLGTDRLPSNTTTSPASTSSGAGLFNARPTTADRETDRRNRDPSNWKGMQIGSEEIWRNESVGIFAILREEVGRKPDQDSVKGPQQRLLIRDIRYRETGARPEHPPVIVHKHSKTMAFSISRYYKTSVHPHASSSAAASPRPSTVVSRSQVPGATTQQPRSSRIILLAPRKVQVAFTSTRTTGMLADYGLLAGDGERERRLERERQRDREKERLRKEKEKRNKGKGKEKEKDLTVKEKERRKSVLSGRKKISSQPSSSNLKDSDRGTKSEGFAIPESRRLEGGPSDSSDAFDDVGVMSAPERLRAPPSSAASSASGHGYGSVGQPPLPPHPPNDSSMPYDSSASASSTTSLQSTSASTASTSTSASTYANTPSSSTHAQRYPLHVSRRNKSRRRPYDHEHDGYYQDREEGDNDYDEDDEFNDDDYDDFDQEYKPNDPLSRPRRRTSRTPHSETYGTVDIHQFNALQKHFQNHTPLTYESKLSIFDRISGRSGRVTGKVSTKGVSARDGILRAGGAGASFEPPWVTFLSRGKQEEQRKVINSLNSSFQDVGLLPSVPKDMRGKDSRWGGTGKDTRKRDKEKLKSADRRDASQGSVASGVTKGSDAEDYNVFDSIPSDSLYMLLPLWPGDTDHAAQRDHPYKRLNLPIEKRTFLLVCYKEHAPAENPPNSATTVGGTSESGGHKKSSPTSSGNSIKKDDKNIILPGFIITARQVYYADLQGSGVRVPDEGITVFGPMEEAIREMPGTTGLEGYDTSSFIWDVPEEGGDAQGPNVGRPGMDRNNPSPGFRKASMLDSIVGYCHSRESGVEFDPEALIALGLARVLNPLPIGKIAEEVGEEQREQAMRCELSPVGKAVVQMIWIGGLALTSFGPV
ncbi:hypothetical protein VKT23_001303 [Stygiomarasmius scandens]|uniref:Uncharacterized protein n=1 Tax=Marasmiellus scandens TaxID=2682957 RepID=A0ABR1K6P3_9AGAR